MATRQSNTITGLTKININLGGYTRSTKDTSSNINISGFLLNQTVHVPMEER
jgi:hypothetical protein